MLNPARERPGASVAGSPLCRAGVLMGTNDGAIEGMEVPVHLTGLVASLLQGSQGMWSCASRNGN